MYTGNWWREKQKELPAGDRLILVLLANNKNVMSLSYGDRVLWPIYVIIGNLDAKIRWSQNRPAPLLLG